MRARSRRAKTLRRVRVGVGVCTLSLSASCRFDPAYRDVPQASSPACSPSDLRCAGDILETCAGMTAPTWQTKTDCHAQGLTCVPSLRACALCVPGSSHCQEQTVETCTAAGDAWRTGPTCDTANGYACREGACAQLCQLASEQLSNVGCEYWGVDLDNAVLPATFNGGAGTDNAAAQQYAIVVSNVQPDVPATVTVEEDDSLPGDATHRTQVVATSVITAQDLDVFKLGPREVDGSADGTFNTGTGTALTRHAYRITSNFPVVAYQFNPLENVDVFSNDASLLLPVSGLNLGQGRAYVVPGWPQTLALTTDPTTNSGIDLRAFVAIVGTRPDTHVHFKTAARVIPGGPFEGGIDKAAEVDAVLQPFEVLNLETGDFDADFTGTLINADQPIAVFPGSECGDSPIFSILAQRSCCCDHLEHQTTPVRAVGKSYVLAKMPNRSKAVIAAGGEIGEVEETEYYRVVATGAGPTHVTTTLPGPESAFDLAGEGDVQTIAAQNDFLLDASGPVLVLDVQSGQQAAGVPLSQALPGGDPSTSLAVPREQWRSDYVLLTPDKYAFDFLVIVAPGGAHAYVDGMELDASNSEVTPSDGLTETARGTPTPPFWTYRYQLDFPIVDPTAMPPNNVRPGVRNDGVHRVQADAPVSVTAYGFDWRVSYAYAGGTQLTVINPQ